MRWWAERIDAIEASSRGLPAGSLHVAGLDELVAGDREAAYGALLAFCGIEEEPEMRAFFDVSR